MNPKALAWLRRQSFRITWRLRSVWFVTEWRKGCVYKTRQAGYIICSEEYEQILKAKLKNIQIGSVSTKITKEIES